MGTTAAVLITMAISGLVVSIEAVCDGFAFGHCASKLQRGSDGMDGVFWSAEDLASACTSYEAATDCMQDVLPDCVPELAERWMTEVQAYDYLCGSARLEYEGQGYEKCYNSSNAWLLSDLTWCRRTKDDIRNVIIRTSRHWLPHHVHHVVCKMLQQYEMCVSRTIVHRCGLDEATWQREVLHQLLLPQIQEEKC